jgi:hypothetical protein
MYRGWTKTDYQDKHCITDQTDKGTEDDRGRDGRANFTWRIKEQATRLNPLFEHDDDDDGNLLGPPSLNRFVRLFPIIYNCSLPEFWGHQWSNLVDF